MNLMTVPLDGNTLRFGAREVPVAREAAQGAGASEVVGGVRPEDMEGCATGEGMKTTVKVVEELGADAYVYGTEVDGTEHDIIARVDGREVPGKGEVLHFVPRTGNLHLFSSTTGERLDG